MNALCEVCGAIGYEHLLLCCTDCKGGHTHQYCLDKVLFDATLEDWFCDECKQWRNEGSHSRSLEKVSSERPSNHARFDSTSQQAIIKRPESARVVGTWGQQKRKYTVVGANLKKKHSSRAKSLRKKCIRNKSNMRGKGINRRGIRSKRSSNFTEQLNLSIGQVGSALLSKGVKQPTPVIVNALGYALGDTGQSHVLKPLEGLAHKSMQTPQSLTTDQVYSTSSLEISSKAKFALEASATEVEISDTVQNLRKDSPKKRRRLILTGDDEDEEEEEKAEDVQLENVNHQHLKCNEPMVKDRVNAEYYVEEVVQSGDFNDQNLINGWPMKRRRRYIVESEDEDDIEGAESALNNASKWSLNDSAKMASKTPVATDHSALLAEQYHLFQGKHYLWGVFRQRKDILDNVHDEEQDGSVQATEQRQHQEHDLLDQQDEALYDVLDKETFAVKHVVDSEDQLQVEGGPKGTKRSLLMRCSFKNIIMAAGVLSDDAKDKVRSLGFGDLLDLTVESLQSRERIIWLAERCDVSSEGERFVMKINPGKSLEITPELVHDELGIPRGCGDNNNFLLGIKLTAKEKMNEYIKLCNELKQAGFVVDFPIKAKNKDGKKKSQREKVTRIKLDTFIQYMKGIRDVDKQVKCFLCILMNRLLLPTTSDYITGENIAFCSDLESMKKQDWCKIVCQRLKDGILEWIRKKGKEKASDAVPTGCTAVLLISYLDSLLPESESEQEKPRIKHYNKEKLAKMLAQANEKDKMEKSKKDKENEKDKMEKHKKDKKENCKQKMYDYLKHKESEQDMVAQIPSLKHLLTPFLENLPDSLQDEINTALENHQTKINIAVENHQIKMFQEMSSLQSEAVAEIKKIVVNCNMMSATSG